jgi:hypothetical protein
LQQDQIGWDCVIEGCFGTAWLEAQQQYLISISSKRNSLRWLTSLIHKLWDVAWDLWTNRNGYDHQQDHADQMKLADDQLRQNVL